ncbi:hypothetical protein DMA11_06625 [Marinilabiliaceae bacterium JC017]|nr:hypothetical protein DMA11_06625 [Marinilabiliaceae bacterium JC017]
MNNMKKLKYILSLSLLWIAVSISAQESYVNIQYNMGFPVGNTQDFVDKTSFRGSSFEFGKYLNDNISVGMGIGWNTFYQSFPKATYPIEGGEITGKKYNYINAVPIMANVKYHFTREGPIHPYVGLHVGTFYMENRTDIGMYSFADKGWTFGIAPEAGVAIPVGQGVNFLVSAKYNQSFETSKIDQQGWFNLNFGISFTF